MGPNSQLLTAIRARRGAQHEVERVLGIHRQPRDLCARVRGGVRDGPGLAVVPIQGQGAQRCRSELDRIPLEHHRGLRGISDPEYGARGGIYSVLVVDLLLERVERIALGSLCGVVARNLDVDYRPAGYAGREEDRGEFDLCNEVWLVFGWRARGVGGVRSGVCLYHTLLLREENCEAGINLADSERYKHYGGGGGFPGGGA